MLEGERVGKGWDKYFQAISKCSVYWRIKFEHNTLCSLTRNTQEMEIWISLDLSLAVDTTLSFDLETEGTAINSPCVPCPWD